MASKKEKALAPAPVQSGYLALANTNLGEMLAEELNGLDITFERIKVPSAGSTMFEVPGEDVAEPESVKEFSAVILWQHALFAYYKNAYTGGNNPPDCGSFDGKKGEGDPGGDCESCPLNQFGSAEGGGKACKNRRRIYLLREGEIFPMLLSLPTGSLKEFTRYLVRTVGKQGRICRVVTRFSLKKAVNASGIAYSQAQFAIDRLLTDEEFAVIVRLADQVKSFSSKVALEYDSAVDIPGDEELIDPDTGSVIQPLA